MSPLDYASPPVVTPKRLTREEKKAQTRERLLEAGAKLFAERGFHGASVEDVAERAGFSTGAIYRNFASKDDFFLAVFEQRIERRVAKVASAVGPATTPAERTRLATAEWMQFVTEERDWFLLLIEFWAYAVRSERLRPRFAERFGAFRETTRALIEDGLRDRGTPPPIAAGELALAVNALGYGLAIEKLADPEVVPEGLYGDLIAMLLGTLTRAGGSG